ncbi:FBD-associated F-box protein [Senna tora]|uniref:FBD-associated F-box protein n=1 Tax=Senna tora TaxID=362788 RepID=A0A834TPC6_9FABA|nr:FBD-associated F-box protein [Senna tora]
MAVVLAMFDDCDDSERWPPYSISTVEAGNEHREVEKATTKLENLPLPLIHHIMDSLSSKDSTKFSILSKTFNSSWLTYPVLNFDNALFPIQHPHAFKAFVHRTFQLRAPHILGCLDKLRFCYKVHLCFFFYDFKPLVTELLYFASHNNCKVLDFEVDMIVSQSLSIPYNALHPMLSSKFLTTLKLSGFTLLIPDLLITCPALKLLSITFFDVPGKCIVSEALTGVATKILHVRCCNLAKNMKIYNPNMEILQLENCGVVENLVVSAPNIEYFEFSRGFWGQSSAIDISACACLTLLALEGAIIMDGTDISKRVCVENMVSPLHDVKHVIVKMGDILRGHTIPSLVESLLWLALKPDILTLESSFKRKKSTIKFKYRWNAQKMDKEEDNCCIGLLIKCWRHYDLHIEYEGFDDNNGGNQLREFFASCL